MLSEPPSSAWSEELRPFTGPAVWYGSELASSSAWIHRLGGSEIDEIAAAVATVRRRGLRLEQVGRDDFVLARLGPVLVALSGEVVDGRGFVLLRGLPVQTWTREESAFAYWGIGTHFGRAVSQNARGHLLGHVKDLGGNTGDPERRVYTTSQRQRFHTDSCDVVGLLCLQTAKQGGLSSLASSVTIYNEMLKTRPDLVAVLAQPFFVDRKGEVPAGKKPYYELAVFHHHGGPLTTIYARDFIESAQRFPEVPRLSAAQIEAMDLLETLAASEAVRLDMELAAGDVQLLHNHQILHARTGYQDHAEPARRRHLLRLWLCPPRGRPLPAAFTERYGSIEPGRRGGIVVPGAELHAPLEAG